MLIRGGARDPDPLGDLRGEIHLALDRTPSARALALRSIPDSTLQGRAHHLLSSSLSYRDNERDMKPW